MIERMSPERDYGLPPSAVPVHFPAVLSATRKEALRADVKRLLKERDAVLVAHYYVAATSRTSPMKPAVAWLIP